jgi:hypothetical protein
MRKYENALHTTVKAKEAEAYRYYQYHHYAVVIVFHNLQNNEHYFYKQKLVMDAFYNHT